MNNFFEIKNKKFRISGSDKVRNVSFSIKNEGDIICLLGPSGIGKTTILRSIAGLEKISQGKIILKDKILSSENIHVEPEDRKVSLSFQENSLFPHYTIEKNIYLSSRNTNRDKININELINILNLENILNKYPHQISAGEAQRASLARPNSNPDLLLLDEPFQTLIKVLRGDTSKIETNT